MKPYPISSSCRNASQVLPKPKIHPHRVAGREDVSPSPPPQHHELHLSTKCTNKHASNLSDLPSSPCHSSSHVYKELSLQKCFVNSAKGKGHTARDLKSIGCLTATAQRAHTVTTESLLRPISIAASRNFKFAAPAEALNLHETLELARAEHFKDTSTVDKLVESKLKGWEFRIVVLKEIAKASMNYAIKSGERKGEVICLHVNMHEGITEQQRRDMIDIMVDIESCIWEDKGIIAKRYEMPLLLDRSKFRSQRRDLWKTACKNLQLQNENWLSKLPAINTTYSQRIGGGGRKTSNQYPRNDPSRSSLKTKSSKEQLKRWQGRFSKVKKRLQEGKFLNEEFFSRRLVTDCQVLERAHMLNGRMFTSRNINSTCTEVGALNIKEKGFITPLSVENEGILVSYLNHLQEFEAVGQHYLGPHFCHEHEGAGNILHMLRDCKAGHFFLYQAECFFEGDRLDAVERTTKQESRTLDTTVIPARDDLFGILEHEDGRDEWSVVLDPKRYSNFARYAGGVSPKTLDDANGFAFTVAGGGFYHIIIVFDKDVKAGEAVQYYYRGLYDEMDYKKIPSCIPPCTE